MYLKNKAIAVLINQFQLPVNVLDLLEKLDGSCVTHRLHLSLLMCCHTAAASDVRNEWPSEPSELYYQQWGRTHECVAGELLCDPGRNYPDSLWLGSFRLSASLCVRCGDRAGWGASGYPLSWAQNLSLPISSHSVVLGQAVLSTLLPPQCEIILRWWRWVL